jgi:hypothetical protein
MRIGWLLLAGPCAVSLAAPAMAAVQHSRLEGGIEGIYVTGEILAGDEVAFQRLAEQYPRAVVFLDSPGGSLVPGIEIGKLVRQKHYATVVLDQSTCNSACALIWLAGTPRHLEGQGHLGFHASYSEEGGRLVETGVGNAMVGHYLSQLGLSEKAVIFATSASPYEVAWLNSGNSTEAEIEFEPGITGVPAPDRTLLVDTSILQKAQVVVSEVPGKATPPSDPDKSAPDEPEESGPDELTKGGPSPGKQIAN